MAAADRQRWWEVALYRFVRALILGVAKVFGRIKIIGRSNIPRDGPSSSLPCTARTSTSRWRRS